MLEPADLLARSVRPVSWVPRAPRARRVSRATRVHKVNLVSTALWAKPVIAARLGLLAPWAHRVLQVCLVPMALEAMWVLLDRAVLCGPLQAPLDCQVLRALLALVVYRDRRAHRYLSIFSSIYLSIYLRKCRYLSVYQSIHVYVGIGPSIHLYICMSVSVCLFIYLHVGIRLCIYLSVCICIYIYTSVCTCIYIYTYYLYVHV